MFSSFLFLKMLCVCVCVCMHERERMGTGLGEKTLKFFITSIMGKSTNNFENVMQAYFLSHSREPLLRAFNK